MFPSALGDAKVPTEPFRLSATLHFFKTFEASARILSTLAVLSGTV
jgi:hypothetical protein